MINYSQRIDQRILAQVLAEEINSSNKLEQYLSKQKDILQNINESSMLQDLLLMNNENQVCYNNLYEIEQKKNNIYQEYLKYNHLSDNLEARKKFEMECFNAFIKFYPKQKQEAIEYGKQKIQDLCDSKNVIHSNIKTQLKDDPLSCDKKRYTTNGLLTLINISFLLTGFTSIGYGSYKGFSQAKSDLTILFNAITNGVSEIGTPYQGIFKEFGYIFKALGIIDTISPAENKHIKQAIKLFTNINQVSSVVNPQTIIDRSTNVASTGIATGGVLLAFSALSASIFPSIIKFWIDKKNTNNVESRINNLSENLNNILTNSRHSEDKTVYLPKNSIQIQFILLNYYTSLIKHMEYIENNERINPVLKRIKNMAINSPIGEIVGKKHILGDIEELSGDYPEVTTLVKFYQEIAKIELLIQIISKYSSVCENFFDINLIEGLSEKSTLQREATKRLGNINQNPVEINNALRKQYSVELSNLINLMEIPKNNNHDGSFYLDCDKLLFELNKKLNFFNHNLDVENLNLGLSQNGVKEIVGTPKQGYVLNMRNRPQSPIADRSKKVEILSNIKYNLLKIKKIAPEGNDEIILLEKLVLLLQDNIEIKRKINQSNSFGEMARRDCSINFSEKYANLMIEYLQIKQSKNSAIPNDHFMDLHNYLKNIIDALDGAFGINDSKNFIYFDYLHIPKQTLDNSILKNYDQNNTGSFFGLNIGDYKDFKLKLIKEKKEFKIT